MQPARSSQEVPKRGGASSVPYGLLCHAAVADIWGAGKTGGVHFAAPYGRKTCIPVCQTEITELHAREGSWYLRVEDQLPGVRVHNGKPLVRCRVMEGRIVGEEPLRLKAGMEAEERLSRFVKEMYRKPAAGISLAQTKEAVRRQLVEKGFRPAYPYGGLISELADAGFARSFSRMTLPSGFGS